MSYRNAKGGWRLSGTNWLGPLLFWSLVLGNSAYLSQIRNEKILRRDGMPEKKHPMGGSNRRKSKSKGS
jgi:hypothetical protein